MIINKTECSSASRIGDLIRFWLSFGFLAHKDLNYLLFKYFGFERTDEGDLRWYRGITL